MKPVDWPDILSPGLHIDSDPIHWLQGHMVDLTLSTEYGTILWLWSCVHGSRASAGSWTSSTRSNLVCGSRASMHVGPGAPGTGVLGQTWCTVSTCRPISHIGLVWFTGGHLVVMAGVVAVLIAMALRVMALNAAATLPCHPHQISGSLFLECSSHSNFPQIHLSGRRGL